MVQNSHMRTITPPVLEDLKRKMVFIGGPRQVGKTTLAKWVLERHHPSGVYFNWDFDEHRRDILAKKWSRDNDLIVFDEFHKYPRWKSWLKGVYDVMHEHHAFLVTGSARLDVYRRGGDSLMGRYHSWRLHPFTLDELPEGIAPRDALQRLLRVGGFPEPFIDGGDRFSRRWRRDRYERVVREDVRDLGSVRDIQMLSLFIDLLRERVGKPIVLSNLARDLEISPKTAKSWLEVLERMYLVFTVRPYTKRLPRAVLKPPKVYFFDNADVRSDEGSRFENLVATHLIKRLHFLEDIEGHRMELRYIRDKEGREVDFAVVKDGTLDALIEAKYAEDTPHRPLVYYTERLGPREATQVVATLQRPHDRGRIRITDPLSYWRPGSLSGTREKTSF